MLRTNLPTTLPKRWTRAALAGGVLAALTVLPAVPANAAALGGNVAFDWSVPGAPQKGLTDITFPMTFAPETERVDGIYVAQQFGFSGTPELGYTGLQPRPDKNGKGQMLGIFSSFIPGTTSTDPNCSDGADGGPGVSCNRARVDVVYGHTYALKVANTGGTTWTGTAIDTVTGAKTHLGSYTLPAGTGNLKPSQVGFLETYLDVPDCGRIQKTSVLLGRPTTSSGLIGSIGNPWEYSNCVGKAGFSATRSANGDMRIVRGSLSAPAQASASVSLSPTSVSATVDAAAVKGANRYIVTVDGAYAMESYGGVAYYASQSTSSGKTTLVASQTKPVKPGSTVELFLAPNAPGESDAGRVRLAKSTYTGVSSVQVSGTTVSVGLDAAAQAGVNRFIVTVDGSYLMESYAGSAYYASAKTSGGTVTMSRSLPGIKKGSTVEVFLVPGMPGWSTDGGMLLKSYTVS